VDELNSAIGRVLAHDGPIAIRTCLEDVQHDLFELGAELCLPGVTKIENAHLMRLETHLDGFNKDLPPLKEFILPGGSPCRPTRISRARFAGRAERTVVALGKRIKAETARAATQTGSRTCCSSSARVLNRAAGKPDGFGSRQEPLDTLRTF
jgi:cob(I)alamin adenosyltransferase